MLFFPCHLPWNRIHILWRLVKIGISSIIILKETHICKSFLLDPTIFMIYSIYPWLKKTKLLCFSKHSLSLRSKKEYLADFWHATICARLINPAEVLVSKRLQTTWVIVTALDFSLHTTFEGSLKPNLWNDLFRQIWLCRNRFLLTIIELSF